MRHSKMKDIFIRISSYYSLPTIHSLDSCALLFQPIVALLIAFSWQIRQYIESNLSNIGSVRFEFDTKLIM